VAKREIDSLGRANASSSSPDDLLVDVLIGLWRIETVVDNSALGKRVSEIGARLSAKLGQSGFTIQDRTGQFYDPGMPLKVLTSVPQLNSGRSTILETVSPTILRHGQILRAGEVIVGVPKPEGASCDE